MPITVVTNYRHKKSVDRVYGQLSKKEPHSNPSPDEKG
jgi:hypothetical protein